jgi:hypothetical protein
MSHHYRQFDSSQYLLAVFDVIPWSLELPVDRITHARPIQAPQCGRPTLYNGLRGPIPTLNSAIHDA